jgi:hypothetical protein
MACISFTVLDFACSATHVAEMLLLYTLEHSQVRKQYLSGSHVVHSVDCRLQWRMRHKDAGDVSVVNVIVS